MSPLSCHDKWEGLLVRPIRMSPQGMGQKRQSDKRLCLDPQALPHQYWETGQMSYVRFSRNQCFLWQGLWLKDQSLV